MTSDLLPDSVPVAIAVYANHPLLTSYSGPRVGVKVLAGWDGYCLRIVRVGGTLLDTYADRPRLQLDCWGPADDAGGEGTADFALRVAACVPDLAGPHPGAYVVNPDIADGPIPEPSDEGRPRVRLDVTFEIYRREV